MKFFEKLKESKYLDVTGTNDDPEAIVECKNIKLFNETIQIPSINKSTILPFRERQVY